MKEFVFFCSSKTDVFVPVSQLSTRDLFDFLENLKLSKTCFCLEFSRQVRSVEQRALWYPYSRLFFGIVFKKMSFLENIYIYNFTKSIVVSILDFWHISFRKMFEWMTCKMRIISLSLGRDIENVFYLKDSHNMASLWGVIRHFISQGGVFDFFFLLRRKSPYRVGRHVGNVRLRKE